MKNDAHRFQWAGKERRAEKNERESWKQSCAEREREKEREKEKREGRGGEKGKGRKIEKRRER